MRPLTISLLGAVLVLGACKNAEQEQLERGVAFARAALERAGRDQIAAMSLQSISEMGGTLVQYLAANAPENADLPRFEDGRPTQPWTVVVRDEGAGVVILEGFGSDLNRAIVTDTVRMARRPAP